MSSSLWGCELKNWLNLYNVRYLLSSSMWGCELKRWWTKFESITWRHPPCEDVSWKVIHHLLCSLYDRHPSCEDVSWKNYIVYLQTKGFVILHVRMWVEKFYHVTLYEKKTSSSMWGCELKSNESIFQKSIAGHPPCEDVSWKTCEFNDSILADGHPPCEDVSWKISGDVGKQLENRHPPCEDVSWKVNEASIRNGKLSHSPCEDVSWKENDVKMYGTQV